MTEKTESTTLHIEYYDVNHKWVASGSAPQPYFSKESPQTLPRSVWVAYVDYLNAREKYAPTESRGLYRLTSYTTTTTKEVTHV